MKFLALTLAVAGLSMFSIAGTTSTADTNTAATMPKGDIIETAIANGQFTTLAAALTAADLIAPLQGKGPFTVFAPTDAAFAALPKGTLESLLKPANKGTLSTILTYHVVPAKVLAADAVKLTSAASLNGQSFSIVANKRGVTVAGAMITMTDIECSNGVIHVIDSVMMPSTKNVVETAVAAGSFKTLAAALGASDLVETLQGAGPFTVFAPTDAAFAALPKGTVESLLLPENKAKLAGILTFHVAAGRSPASDVVRRSSIATVNGQRVAIEADKRGVRIGGAMISSTDIQCTNGTIHVLDAVMLPSTLNVVQTAVEAGTFKTLAAALGAGGLVRVLEGPGPFTVFAPTDEAFAALPKGTVESLLLPENKDLLVAILKNHVVSGRVYSDQLSSGRVASIGGTKLTVKVSEAGVMVGAAKVISADIETTNGVVHAVNAVILPE
ncbi:MAG: transforming growth factor-beta-induced protein [Bacteroidia bacterium]|jgi:uncharacterized surface protein with fasciclin (FAS1) repeats